MQGILKVYRFIWMIENKKFKKIKISAKISSGESLFPPLVKAKNQHQNFRIHLKQKRCAIRRLNVPNLFLGFYFL